ncbi:MAG: glycosyltransferase family 4 protein [Verrucomicrobia bacterium]|nr:glycosyltransferase family 4 protein [Verrucomicrobiota bacterium]
MKITIVLGAFFPVPTIMGGAIEKVWSSLAKEFARRGHEVVLISRAMPQFPREEQVQGVRYLRVAGFDSPRNIVWLKFLDLIYSLRVRSILPEADVIAPHTFWLPILLRNESRGKVYVHIGRFPKGQMRFYRHVARLQAPTVDLARAVAAEAPELAPKISIVPNPAPSLGRNRPVPVDEREKIILFVGRVHPEKGVHLLIEAFAGAKRALTIDWRMIVVGPTDVKLGGGGESYLAELKNLAVGADVIFRGPVFDSTQLAREYDNARIFIYPSLAERGESFGLAPLEAMTHGCAVIVSDLGCFRDFVSADKTGIVFDHRSADPILALRRKLEDVMADQTLLFRVASAGYAKSADHSVERVADQFLADFNSVVSD